MKIIKIGGTALLNKKDLTTFVTRCKRSNQPTLYVISAFSKLSSELRNYAVHARNDTDLINPTSIFTELCRILNSEQCKIFTHFLGNVSIKLNRLVVGTQKTEEVPQIIIDEIMSFGELLSSFFIHCLFLSNGMESNFKDARLLIRTNSDYGNAAPNISISIENIVENIDINTTIVTQGFIGADSSGKTTTMGFESSNLSAMIFADALQSSEIEIITKVDQIYSFDPETISDSRPIAAIPYGSAKLLSENNFNLIYPGMISIAIKNNITLKYSGLYSNSSTIISSNSNYDIPIIIGNDSEVLITPISKQNCLKVLTNYLDNLYYYNYDESNNSLRLRLNHNDIKKVHEVVISLF